MALATIQSIIQTEEAGLFTIIFEGESFTEFQKFITKGNANAKLLPDLQKILTAIQRMMNTAGFFARYFRPEGNMNDSVVALWPESRYGHGGRGASTQCGNQWCAAARTKSDLRDFG